MSPRGGKRPGAGRPPEKDRRATLAVRVEQVTKARLEEFAHRNGVSMGAALDFLVEQHL